MHFVFIQLIKLVINCIKTCLLYQSVFGVFFIFAEFVIMPKEEQFLKVGDNLHLTCAMIESTEEPTNSTSEFDVYGIKIKQRGQTNHPRAVFNYHMAEKSVELLVRNVYKDDSGTYECFYVTDEVQESTDIDVGSKSVFWVF